MFHADGNDSVEAEKEMMFAGKRGVSSPIGGLTMSKVMVNMSMVTVMTALYMDTGAQSRCGGGNKIFF